MAASEDHFQQIEASLDAKRGEIIGTDKWLNKWDHGAIIANVYQVPVIFYCPDLTDCTTLLPTRTSPSTDPKMRTPIVLVYVNQCHFVRLYFKKDVIAPYPRVPSWWDGNRVTKPAA